MKFLIAFALFAVAVAVDEVQVVHLPEAPAPAFEQNTYVRPQIVPLAVLESMMAELVKTAPAVPEPVVLYSASVAEGTDDAEGIKVHVVDSPVEDEQAPEVLIYRSSVSEQADGVEAFVADNEGLKVRFVDSPVYEPVVVEEVPSVEAVKVVEAPRLGKVFADPRLR